MKSVLTRISPIILKFRQERSSIEPRTIEQDQKTSRKMEQQSEDASDISLPVFLAWEKKQTEKHELVDGQVITFAGGSLDHSRIARNVLTALDAALHLPCQAYGSDAGIETANRKRPNAPRADVSVSCATEDAGNEQCLRAARLLIEVISRSLHQTMNPTKTGARNSMHIG